MTDSQIYAGAAVLGAPAGRRSTSPLAMVSRLARAGLLQVRNALCGAAVGAAYAAYHLRSATGERSGIPDPVLALVEAPAVVAGGWLVFHFLNADTKEA